MQSQADENANLMEMDLNESGGGPVLQSDENQSNLHLLVQRDMPFQVETDFTGEDCMIALSSSGPTGK